MRKKVKRTAVAGAGVFFMALGTVGLALPFLQGLLFIAIGLILLSFAFPAIRHWMQAHTQKYPKLHSAIQRAEHWILARIGPMD